MKKLLIVLITSTLSFYAVNSLSAVPPTRVITQISDSLYRFQNNAHYSVFLVTSEGIIVTDPINKDAATWLKAELKKRFDKPIKYLIYSHDHRDHIAGGEVYDKETIVVAHENAKATIIGEKRPTAVPDVTFSDRMTVELGGQKVELIYVGESHSDNMIVMHFPAQRAVFAVDFISINRMPYKDLSDSYFPGWIKAIKQVEQLDFDLLIPGHGKTGNKDKVTEHRRYLETLYNEVLAAARAGKTLEEAQESIKIDNYQHFGQYDAWLKLNIAGVYRQVMLHRRGN